MAAQMRYLLEVATLGHVTIVVLPAIGHCSPMQRIRADHRGQPRGLRRAPSGRRGLHGAGTGTRPRETVR
jgi:hypothetical protein